MTTYTAELRANWRPLLATMIGLSCGFTAMAFTGNIMGPHLIEEFGWSKAQYALIGTLSAMTLIALPLSGRLVDMFGVRRTASIGFVVGPVGFLVLSQMSGDFTFYVLILVTQNLFCMTTTSTVFTRTVVQHIKQSRGLALALVASGPALLIAIVGPLFNNFVEMHGWRVGYVALAIFMIVGGIVTIALVPSDGRVGSWRMSLRKSARKDYGMLLHSRPFWILVGGITLTNLSQFISNSQINMLLLENGMTVRQISGMISIFAIGVLIGRFACGLALDRFSAPVISMIVMALPAVGLFLLATPFDSYWVLSFAILTLGLSYGAESDILAYLVSHIFNINIYGTVLGLMTASLSLGSTCGALLLSATLNRTGNYDVFLIITGLITLVGSLLFLLLPGRNEQKGNSAS